MRKPALGFIFVTLFLDILGIGLIIPILPKLIEQLSGGNVTAASHYYGWLVALYSLMQFLCAPAIGSLSDKYGRRPVILVSLLGSGLDYLLLGFAPSLWLFFVGRIVAGMTGANITAASAYIADVSPPEKRAANFGILGAAFGLGFVAGPALGGVLGDYGLRIPFFAAAGLTLLNWLYGLLVLPESLSRENRRAFDWSRANPVGSFVALKRHPALLGLTETYFLMHLAHQVFPSTWVLYTGYRFGWSPKQVGLSLAVVGIMAAIVQGGLARKMIPKFGEKRSVFLGLINSVIFFTCYGLATKGWMIYPLIVVGSICSIAMPAVQGLISRSVPANEQGGVQGALTSLASLTGILGPLIYTTLFGNFVGDDAPVLLPGIACFTGAFLMFIALLLASRALQKIPTVPNPVSPASVPVAE